jgi:hypothetical protein
MFAFPRRLGDKAACLAAHNVCLHVAGTSTDFGRTSLSFTLVQFQRAVMGLQALFRTPRPLVVPSGFDPFRYFQVVEITRYRVCTMWRKSQTISYDNIVPLRG